MYQGKQSLLNDVTSWRSCLVVVRGCVNRICTWPLRRDDHSRVLIGAGGKRRSDWPPRVLANYVRTRIDRLHVCRYKWQLAATSPLVFESQKCRQAVPNSLCSGNLIGWTERGNLTSKDCVSLDSHTYINIT